MSGHGPITRDYELSDDQFEKLTRAIQKRGGSVIFQDSRLDKFRDWALAAIGTGILCALGWLANSVDNLNRNMAAANVRWEDLDKRISRMEDREHAAPGH